MEKFKKNSLRILLFPLLLAMAAPLARADIENAPFMPEIDRRFNAIEQGNHYNYNTFPMGSKDGHWAQQVAQATYDFSVNGGLTGFDDLKVSLPKGAVIEQAGAWSITQPTTSASGTLAFTCGTAGFLFVNSTAAASYGAANHAIAGNQNGTITNWSTITAPCDIEAYIATGALTAGKVTLFVQYWMHQ